MANVDMANPTYIESLKRTHDLTHTQTPVGECAWCAEETTVSCSWCGAEFTTPVRATAIFELERHILGHPNVHCVRYPWGLAYIQGDQNGIGVIALVNRGWAPERERGRLQIVEL